MRDVQVSVADGLAVAEAKEIMTTQYQWRKSPGGGLSHWGTGPLYIHCQGVLRGIIDLTVTKFDFYVWVAGDMLSEPYREMAGESKTLEEAQKAAENAGRLFVEQDA